MTARAPPHDASPFRVEGEVRLADATVQLVHFHMTGSTDTVMATRDDYWLDLCLTPRHPDARGFFERRGTAQAYEPLGDVFVAPPGQRLRARAEGGDQVSILCLLRPHAVERWFAGGIDWTPRRLAAMLDVRSGTIRGLLLRLVDEVRQPGIGSIALADAIVAQLAIELARHCDAVNREQATGGLAPWRLRLIDERLAATDAAPTLADLARLCNMSVRQLTRGFRESRDASIGDHVARSRIETAKRLLATGEGMKAIAHAMGFSTPSSFAHAFRRETGETPSRFRQRLHCPDRPGVRGWPGRDSPA